ncbi:MAG: heavy metal translocating P-type ATPase [Pseudomonadota bacterium]
MSCCADPRAAFIHGLASGEMAQQSASGAGSELTLSVSGLHCAGCIGSIERAVAALPGTLRARVNFTHRTVTLSAREPPLDPTRAIQAIRNLGYVVRPLSNAPERDKEGRELIRAIGVAGFGAMNVMLLSVAVWAGADGETRQMLNWFAALIALPALTYAARPFIRSAIQAVAGWRMNMDVPIAVAIVLAAGLSLTKTIAGDGETYFDAAVTLTFFLLVGRYLSHQTRERARGSLNRLAQLQPSTANVVGAGGETTPIPVGAVAPGMVLSVAAGARVPVDASMVSPSGAFDASLITGESKPVTRRAGELVGAGLLALDGPLKVTAAKACEDSLLSRLSTLQRAAEAARPPLSRIADRAAQVYAPVVHLVALFTFLGWWAAGAGAGEALTIAIATLIITCPCALGLAVPMVQAAASDRLFRLGLVVKDGAALERLRTIDEVVFDKTGTLTTVTLDGTRPVDDGALRVAASLARHSTHPVAQAVHGAATDRGLHVPPSTEIVEHPGEGISGLVDGCRVFLGRKAPDLSGGKTPMARGAGLTLHREGLPPLPLTPCECVREGARELVDYFAERGIPAAIVSGDAKCAVEPVAKALNVDDWTADCRPGTKVERLKAHRARGTHPLMIGDGINDGPALAAADASIAVADASDLACAAADIVMTTDRIEHAGKALDVAQRAHRLTVENLAICAVYNAIAIPIAISGHATPLVAAIMMSTSSLVVVANSQRIRGDG